MSGFKGIGKVGFLACKKEVEIAIEAGWPIKVIYTELADKLSISYSQFSRYVKKFITGPMDRQVAAVKEESQAVPSGQLESESIQSFSFSPTPKKSDLI